MKETIVYDIKAIDGNYITIEKDGEDVVVHPGTKTDSIIEKDTLIMIPVSDRFHTQNIHAIRCGCKKCCGLMSSFMGKVKETGATVIDSRDTNAIKNAFESLKATK